MSWLPFEHRGARSCAEALGDLLTIARSDDVSATAHLEVDPDDGEVVKATGRVTVGAGDGGGPLRLAVDGERIAELDPGACRGAWLITYDGADYYTLKLDFGWCRLSLSDAYNGL